MFRRLISSGIITLMVMPAFAQTVRVAVAANAQYVVKKLATDFKKKTGLTVEVISGSSGKLSAQIQNGAPYDLFLSADMDFAQSVYGNGFALTKPKTYAYGSLIVCSSTGADVKNWKKYIATSTSGKIAIGNPKLAPYGKAAEESLNHFALYKAIASRLGFAESISQVNTYVLKGVVNIGFTTESLFYELDASQKFVWEKVDPSSYEPIAQGAVLLKHAKNKNYSNNKKFYDYLFSADAKAIFRKFGYKTA